MNLVRESCEQKFVNGVGLGGKCRDGAVELYRVALMYGICLLHTVNFGGYQKWWLANVLYTCVVGFVFISGWFGIRFGKYFVEDCRMSAFVMYPLVALIVFCLAFALDIPRRLFLSFCHRG